MLWLSLPGTKFFALWHSSKHRTPENSGPPTQSMTCCSRFFPLWLEIRVEYVLRMQGCSANGDDTCQSHGSVTNSLQHSHGHVHSLVM